MHPVASRGSLLSTTIFALEPDRIHFSDIGRRRFFTAITRPVFVANFDYETRQSEPERLFSKYGRLERVDMKSGFAFVYFEDERDSADAIHGLDDMPFSYDRRKLSVEWAKGVRAWRGGSRFAFKRPAKTLFVINFDPIHTRFEDIRRHFEPYGEVVNARNRQNFAFVQFKKQEYATKALECTHKSKILDRVVTVDYALSDDGERADRPRRERHYGRSLSPAYHGQGSPDYGRRRSSPTYDRYIVPSHDRCRSPDYGRNQDPQYGRNRSPKHGRFRSGPTVGRT